MRPVDELPDEIEFEDRREVLREGFARRQLQEDHVLGLNQNPFPRIAQCPVQIDANGDLTSIRRPANDADAGLRYLGYWTDNVGLFWLNGALIFFYTCYLFYFYISFLLLCLSCDSITSLLPLAKTDI